jgi:hypothetical protein
VRREQGIYLSGLVRRLTTFVDPAPAAPVTYSEFPLSSDPGST